MIDIEKIRLGSDHIGPQIKIADPFKCEFCDQIFDGDAFSVSIFLYGIFFLVGKEKGYSGINCPKCLKTLLMHADKDALRNFFSQVSPATFKIGQNRFPIGLRYHSMGHNNPEAYGNSANQYLMPRIFPIRGINFEQIQSQVRFGFDETIDGGYKIAQSFYFDEHPPIGPELTDLYLILDDIPKVVEIENNEGKRIIPRYIHAMSIYELFDAFYWNYSAQANQLEQMKIEADQAYRAFIQSEEYQKAKGNKEQLDELYEANPNINSALLIEDMIEKYTDDSEWESGKISSDFNELLAHRLDDFDLPAQNHPSTITTFGRQHPFKDVGIPLRFFDSFQEKFDMADEKIRALEISKDVIDYFKKGYGRQFLSENYLDFIEEYDNLLRKNCFSYADVKDLQEKYLMKAYEAMKIEALDDKPYAFFKEGNSYSIRFNGKPIKALTQGGWKYIYHLVKNPVPTKTFDLNALHGVDPETIDPNDSKGKKYMDLEFDSDKEQNVGKNKGPKMNVDRINDPETFADYRNRYGELQREIALYEKNKDILGLAEAKKEIALLAKEMKVKRVGKKFENKETHTDGAIVKAMYRALKELEGEKCDLQCELRHEVSQHFRKSFVGGISKTENHYYPYPAIDWYFG